MWSVESLCSNAEITNSPSIYKQSTVLWLFSKNGKQNCHITLHVRECLTRAFFFCSLHYPEIFTRTLLEEILVSFVFNSTKEHKDVNAHTVFICTLKMNTCFDGGPAFDTVVQRSGRSLKPRTLTYNKVIWKSVLRLLKVPGYCI